jgi:hypothetical protein
MSCICSGSKLTLFLLTIQILKILNTEEEEEEKEEEE